ncbi:MAG: histidine kinase dimerization/phospho-acceptor domain-containing protein, partial [Myxococcota bacterium]
MDSATNSATSEPFPVRRQRVRLRTLLIAVNLLILGTFILGFWTARFYESELLRQTEVDLTHQGELLQAIYFQRLALDDDGTAARFSHQPEVTQPKPPAQLNIHRAALLPHAPPPEPAPAVPPRIAQAGATLHAITRSAWSEDKGVVELVDHQGVVLASSTAPVGGSIINRDEIRHALRGEQARVLRRCNIVPIANRSNRCLVVVLPLMHEGRVWGAVSLAQAPLGTLSALAIHARVVVVWLVVIVIAMMLQLWYTSRLVVTPIDALIEQSERLAQGDRTSLRPIERPITLEVERLSGAVVAMARTLDERAEYIRTFASNVSHEFKTPLSSIRGSVELLTDLGDTMPTSDRTRFLGIIDRHAERLQRLVNRLLELAKADVAQPGSAATHLQPTLNALTERYRAEGLTLHIYISQLYPTMTNAMESV